MQNSSTSDIINNIIQYSKEFKGGAAVIRRGGLDNPTVRFVNSRDTNQYHVQNIPATTETETDSCPESTSVGNTSVTPRRASQHTKPKEVTEDPDPTEISSDHSDDNDSSEDEQEVIRKKIELLLSDHPGCCYSENRSGGLVVNKGKPAKPRECITIVPEQKIDTPESKPGPSAYPGKTLKFKNIKGREMSYNASDYFPNALCETDAKREFRIEMTKKNGATWVRLYLR